MHKTLSIGHSTNRPRELRGPNTLDWALADATAKPMQLVLLLHKRKGIVRLVGLQRTRWAWWRNDTIIWLTCFATLLSRCQLSATVVRWSPLVGQGATRIKLCSGFRQAAIFSILDTSVGR